MVDSVGFGSSVNSALQGVQRTSQQSNQTNEQLSTGQKINDPLDGAEDFFATLALTNRAADLAQQRPRASDARDHLPQTRAIVRHEMARRQHLPQCALQPFPHGHRQAVNLGVPALRGSQHAVDDLSHRVHVPRLVIVLHVLLHHAALVDVRHPLEALQPLVSAVQAPQT